MNRSTRITLLVISTMLFGCSEDVEQPSSLIVTTVECTQHPSNPWGLSQEGFRGPAWCSSALRRFLRHDPTRRIASVLALENHPVKHRRVERGTQRLLVVHTEPLGSGPWPRADELDLEETSCESRACISQVRRSALRSVIWVPIESAQSWAPGMRIAILELWWRRRVEK